MTQSYEDFTENRRPMTSRSASRNAMTQVDDDLRSYSRYYKTPLTTREMTTAPVFQSTFQITLFMQRHY